MQRVDAVGEQPDQQQRADQLRHRRRRRRSCAPVSSPVIAGHHHDRQQRRERRAPAPVGIVFGCVAPHVRHACIRASAATARRGTPAPPRRTPIAAPSRQSSEAPPCGTPRMQPEHSEEHQEPQRRDPVAERVPARPRLRRAAASLPRRAARAAGRAGCSPFAHRLQPRIAQAAVIIDRHGVEQVAALDQQLRSALVVPLAAVIAACMTSVE